MDADTIEREGSTYFAATCEHCGGKVYPPEALQMHLDRHELKDFRYRGQLTSLQYALARMRS